MFFTQRCTCQTSEGFHFSLSFSCLSTLKGLLYDVICPGDPPTKDKQPRCAIVHPPDIISVLISQSTQCSGEKENTFYPSIVNIYMRMTKVTFLAEETLLLWTSCPNGDPNSRVFTMEILFPSPSCERADKCQNTKSAESNARGMNMISSTPQGDPTGLAKEM